VQKNLERNEIKNKFNVKGERDLEFSRENIIRKKTSANINPGIIGGIVEKTADGRDDIENEKIDLVFKHEIMKFDENKPILIRSAESSVDKSSQKITSIPKLIKSPNVPAPEWFEKKGVTTEMYLQGIIDGDGNLLEAKIVKTSGYYKLDIHTKRFVEGKWLWEPGKEGAEVRIRLYVEFKK